MTTRSIYLTVSFCFFIHLGSSQRVQAATIVSEISSVYPSLTVHAGGGALAQDFTITDQNTSTIEAVSTDGRNPPPKSNTARATINRELTGSGVTSTHEVEVFTELVPDGARASVSDQFIIQTDSPVPFNFSAVVQASLAPSTGNTREASFSLVSVDSGDSLFSYRWLYANEVIFGIPNPTLSPTFSTILQPGTYRFDAYLFDSTQYFGQAGNAPIVTRFDYSFSVPEPTAAVTFSLGLGMLLNRRQRRG